MTEQQSKPRCPQCESDDVRVGQSQSVLHEIKGVSKDGVLLVSELYCEPWESPGNPFLVCCVCGNEWPLGDTEIEFVSE